MGIPGGANLLLAAGGVSTYEIDQSLRFVASSSTRLTRTPSSSGNMKTWTLSMWIKKWNASHSDGRYLWAAGVWSSGNPNTGQYWTAGDKLATTHGINGVNNNGGTTNPSNKFRDPSAWFHLVVRMDTANATTSNRHRVYINGELIATASSVSQNFEGAWNRNVNHAIGGNNNHGTYSDVYIAEVYNVDGQSLDPTSFGEYDDNGVWRPIAYSGSYGTNGFYLKMDPSATNGVGHDHSGNGNNFTASGFTTSGTGTDVFSDTPTNNFPTYNPLFVNINSTSATEGNLNVSAPNDSSTGSTIAIPASGKYYVEFTFSSGTGANGVGIINTTSTGRYTKSLLFSPNNNVYRNGSSIDSAAGTWSSGDLIGLAIDAGAQTVRFYRNNSDLFGANQDFSSIDTGDGFYITVQGGGGQTCSGTLNFGQRAFTYTPPSGFVELCTANLPAPDIADGSQYFNTVLYTGNSGSNHAITGVGFQPDWIWTKCRSSSKNHVEFDVLRGVNKQLYPNTTAAEFSPTTISQVSFDSDGFTLGANSGTNENNQTFVAWNWLAGGSGSSNTSGSITSTVSANPSAGFSIVTYTGNGGSATVGHGLGVAPKLIFVKRRSGTSHWTTYVDSLGPSKYLLLNSSNSATSVSSVFWNSTAPTSTVFSLGSNGDLNGNGSTYVAYCFAEVEGYSRIGSYEGNASTNGPFAYTGFRPAWIMFKRLDGAGDWHIYDVKRSPYNVSNQKHYSNSAAVEEINGYNEIDILSNGFKMRDTSGGSNANGNAYAFMAFADYPLGGDGVSPATAR